MEYLNNTIKKLEPTDLGGHNNNFRVCIIVKIFQCLKCLSKEAIGWVIKHIVTKYKEQKSYQYVLFPQWSQIKTQIN